MSTDQRIRFRHTRQPFRAVEWRIGEPFLDGLREIRIVEMRRPDGAARYAVKMDGWTANKDGEWEYEPLPSSRDDDYFERCRWDDWEDAALMADRMYAAEVSGRGRSPSRGLSGP